MSLLDIFGGGSVSGIGTSAKQSTTNTTNTQNIDNRNYNYQSSARDGAINVPGDNNRITVTDGGAFDFAEAVGRDAFFAVGDALFSAENISRDSLLTSENIAMDSLLTVENVAGDALFSNQNVIRDSLLTVENVAGDALRSVDSAVFAVENVSRDSILSVENISRESILSAERTGANVTRSSEYFLDKSLGFAGSTIAALSTAQTNFATDLKDFAESQSTNNDERLLTAVKWVVGSAVALSLGVALFSGRKSRARNLGA